MFLKVLGKEMMICPICGKFHLLEKRAKEECVWNEELKRFSYEEVVYYVCENDDYPLIQE